MRQYAFLTVTVEHRGSPALIFLSSPLPTLENPASGSSDDNFMLERREGDDEGGFGRMIMSLKCPSNDILLVII